MDEYQNIFVGTQVHVPAILVLMPLMFGNEEKFQLFQLLVGKDW